MTRFEIKIVAALLLIAVIPLAASTWLVGQVIQVSDSVAEGQIQRMAGPLKKAGGAYRSLFGAIKRSFKQQGQKLANDTELLRSLATGDRTALKKGLARLGRGEPEIGLMAIRSSAGEVLARWSRDNPLPPDGYRELRISFPLGGGGHQLWIDFFTPRAPFDDFAALGQVQRAEKELKLIREELAPKYRVVFLILFGAVALAATLLGLFIARRTARQVAVLAQATRRVAEGDLETQVQLKTRDEVGDLARSFNEMMKQIKESGERITYLEKIGAWQEIARRLAHEIKNPLTPIQLAVQQLHRKYEGDDPRFTRMLDDARDIITEEVDGLRRLVQAFSAFAKLPDVRPEPVEVNALIDDFFKSHVELQQQATVSWTPMDDACKVLVDRMLIKHVLFNLTENAIHAAEDAGTLDRLEVRIAARVLAASRRLQLAVSDNGPGMEPETARRVFDPYYTTKDRGTGLGLAIVKKIILEHQGTISLTSTPGAGAHFELNLPLVKDYADRG